MRPVRKGEYTCNCPAYHFPHRFGGGRCSGSWVVDDTWENSYGCTSPCNDCINKNETEDVPYCEVHIGQERVNVCPAWLEFVEYNEIKVTK